MQFRFYQTINLIQLIVESCILIFMFANVVATCSYFIFILGDDILEKEFENEGDVSSCLVGENY